MTSTLRGLLLSAMAFAVFFAGFRSAAYLDKKFGITTASLTSPARGIASVSNDDPSANCHFTTTGWVKVYGKDSVEISTHVDATTHDDLVAQCHRAAEAYIEEHVGEGEIASEKVTASSSDFQAALSGDAALAGVDAAK
jgi:hypothetical protein